MADHPRDMRLLTDTSQRLPVSVGTIAGIVLYHRIDDIALQRTDCPLRAAAARQLAGTERRGRDRQLCVPDLARTRRRGQAAVLDAAAETLLLIGQENDDRVAVAVLQLHSHGI
jgi:hypothetical protein